MKLNTAGTAGILAVGALAVGAFAAGTHLGPAQSVGHNLYQPRVAAVTPPVLVLTSTKTPTTVAQEPGGPHSADMGSDPNSDPNSDSNSGDDLINGDGPGATFQQVYYLVKRHFVDPLPPDSKMAHGAAAAMIASLQDPESRFLESPEVDEINNEAKGQYRGLGAALAVRRIPHTKSGDIPDYTEYRLSVVAPMPSSPAEKAGLMAGDVITTINGQWVYNDKYVYDQTNALRAAQTDPVAFNKMVTVLQKKIDDAISLSDAQTKLCDPVVKTLSLTVMRAGTTQPLTMTLDTSTPTVVSPITARSLPGGIGYIKIAEFTAGADKDFATALAGFGDAPKGLVLDLRNSPGGLLDVGTAIAAKLTTASSLGLIETKGRKVQPIPVTPNSPIAYPVVVLVNGGTANTAELLAATLQSSGAKLVGSTTFGDGSDVKLIVLRDGSGFTMTVGKLMTAAHGDFSGVGIKPDVPLTDTAGDAPLDRAVSVLAGRVARLPSDPI